MEDNLPGKTKLASLIQSAGTPHFQRDSLVYQLARGKLAVGKNEPLEGEPPKSRNGGIIERAPRHLLKLLEGSPPSRMAQAGILIGMALEKMNEAERYLEEAARACGSRDLKIAHDVAAILRMALELGDARTLKELVRTARAGPKRWARDFHWEIPVGLKRSDALKKLADKIERLRRLADGIEGARRSAFDFDLAVFAVYGFIRAAPDLCAPKNRDDALSRFKFPTRRDGSPRERQPDGEAYVRAAARAHRVPDRIVRHLFDAEDKRAKRGRAGRR